MALAAASNARPFGECPCPQKGVMYNKNDLKRMFLAGVMFANTSNSPSAEEIDDAFETSIKAFEAVQQGVEPTLDDLTREDRLSLKPDHWVRATGE